MTRSALEAKPTNSLIKKLRFSNLALRVVWVGAGIALMASIYAFFRDGVFPNELVVIAILSILVSMPVYQEKKQIQFEIGKRGDQDLV